MENVKLAGCETPGPPGNTSRGVKQVGVVGSETSGLPGGKVNNGGGIMCIPSPPKAGALGMSGPSSGSLSPLPLICKCRKPMSTGTSPSGLPPVPKMRAVVVQSAESIDVGLLEESEHGARALYVGGEKSGGYGRALQQGSLGEESSDELLMGVELRWGFSWVRRGFSWVKSGSLGVLQLIAWMR
jgi:hypothetical protein